MLNCVKNMIQKKDLQKALDGLEKAYQFCQDQRIKRIITKEEYEARTNVYLDEMVRLKQELEKIGA